MADSKSTDHAARLDPAGLAEYIRSQTKNGRDLVDHLRSIVSEGTDTTAVAVALAALLQCATGPEGPEERRTREAAEGAEHAEWLRQSMKP